MMPAPISATGSNACATDHVDAVALRGKLEAAMEGEVRFDRLTRTLYSTDASIYQIEPLGVVIAKSRVDVARAVEICAALRCPITVRGGGTSQAGQAIGEGLQLDTSKYLNRLLEVNPAERWARVEPGIVLDELNAQLRPHGLRFAPDVSTSNRATIGGMMANNSSGARSVVYGKTIDHVLEQHAVLADGSIAHLRSLPPAELESICAGETLEASACRTLRRVAAECAGEVERRFPKILRRVGGYNLDEFVSPAGRPFNLARLMVGSEGTLGIVVEAKINLVPLPKARALVVVHFAELLEALAATPAILDHHPVAVEVLDRFVLDATRAKPALNELRDFITGDPGALLIVEFYGDAPPELPARIDALERDLRARGGGYHFHRSFDADGQERIWRLRKAALGLSMAMRGDAKAQSFVEDTAVAPEKLRDYIERFLAIVRRHGTTAGVYAHASVGCLHVRPVVNLKTVSGIRQFEAIANDISDLVLEYGGALSAEHGDGLVRGPFTEKMFGPVLYQAFRDIKRAFDPQGILNPGKIVDSPPLSSNLRFGADYITAEPPTFFDYSEYGGVGRAVEMCSGLGACRKKLEGTMCPSYMATMDEEHTTRGRANALRAAWSGRLDQERLPEEESLRALELCLECRACRTECPTGVDMARFKSEFLAAYYVRNGAPLRARVLGNAAASARWGSRFAPLSNWLAQSAAGRWALERFAGMDRRRSLPPFASRTLRELRGGRDGRGPGALLFNDTFTNYFEPSIGVAAFELLGAAGVNARLAPNVCCGRPLISQGLLPQARRLAERNAELLHAAAGAGARILFCEPSCLSAVREDAPSLLRGEARAKAEAVSRAAMLVEEFLAGASLPLRSGPAKILLHGHCHQKAMGLTGATRTLLSRIPGAAVVELDSGCCGMAGSFGYTHYDVSRRIAELRLLPAVRGAEPGAIIAAPGTSCRHQIADLSPAKAMHPLLILRSVLEGP